MGRPKKLTWTADEDRQLREVLQRLGARQLSNGTTVLRGSWGDVAEQLPGRSAKQCRERWCYNLCPGIRRDHWAVEEDAVLVRAQKRLGNQWALIARQLTGRTENSVKIRFKSIRRAARRVWTKADDALLLSLYQRFGSHWDLIARQMPNRTRNGVKTRCLLLRKGYLDAVPNSGDPEQILKHPDYEEDVEALIRAQHAIPAGQIGPSAAAAPPGDKSPSTTDSPAADPALREGTPEPAFTEPDSEVGLATGESATAAARKRPRPAAPLDAHSGSRGKSDATTTADPADPTDAAENDENRLPSAGNANSAARTSFPGPTIDTGSSSASGRPRGSPFATTATGEPVWPKRRRSSLLSTASSILGSRAGPDSPHSEATAAPFGSFSFPALDRAARGSAPLSASDQAFGGVTNAALAASSLTNLAAGSHWSLPSGLDAPVYPYGGSRRSSLASIDSTQTSPLFADLDLALHRQRRLSSATVDGEPVFTSASAFNTKNAGGDLEIVGARPTQQRQTADDLAVLSLLLQQQQEQQQAQRQELEKRETLLRLLALQQRQFGDDNGRWPIDTSVLGSRSSPTASGYSALEGRSPSAASTTTCSSPTSPVSDPLNLYNALCQYQPKLQLQQQQQQQQLEMSGKLPTGLDLSATKQLLETLRSKTAFGSPTLAGHDEAAQSNFAPSMTSLLNLVGSLDR